VLEGFNQGARVHRAAECRTDPAELDDSGPEAKAATSRRTPKGRWSSDCIPKNDLDRSDGRTLKSIREDNSSNSEWGSTEA
jgi:hypothetical protein